MSRRRYHGLLVLPLLFACFGDEGTGPRRVPSGLEIVAGGMQTGAVAQPLGSALTVRVLDQRDEPIAGVLVQFVLADTAGSLSHLTRTTGPDGQAATVWTLPQVAGAYSALARVAGLDSVEFAATAVPAAAATLALMSGGGQAALADSTLEQPIVVRVDDVFGNPVGDVAVTFAVTRGNGTVTASATSDSAGHASAQWRVGPLPGFDSLRVSVPALTPLDLGAESHPAPPLNDGLDAGEGFSCRLDAGGAASCWGANQFHQLGGGDTVAHPEPTAVNGGQVFRTISLGWQACAITMADRLYCWGANQGTSQTGPVDQAVTARRVSAGRFHFCGLDLVGTAFCAGDNTYGQLGVGSLSGGYGGYLEVAGGLRYRSISAAQNHTCALSLAGRAYCWGWNQFGELGTGTGPDTALAPTAVATTLRFTDLVVGRHHSCGLTLAGDAWCWGRNSSGELGDGSVQDQPMPVKVSGGIRFAELSLGTDHSCGTANDGTGYCWGRNLRGPLGDGTTASRSTPVPVSGGYLWASLRAGSQHTCGRTVTDQVLCWGLNWDGQVGLETATRRTPTPVAGGAQYSMVSVGTDHACAVTVGQVGHCWGENLAGQIGDGTTTRRPVPTAIAGGQSFLSVEAGYVASCGRTPADLVYCWGLGTYHQFGDGTNTARPQPTSPATGLGASSVDVGLAQACSLDTAAEVRCWGENYLGEVGDGTTVPSDQPVVVAGGRQWSGVITGAFLTCGTASTGHLFCWGRNLGNGSDTAASVPDSVHLAVPVARVAIALELSLACAVGTDQAGYCWGSSNTGALGDGNDVSASTTPVPVIGGYAFQDIAVGTSHACGLTPGGQVVCWGSNALGQLGDGTFLSRATPGPVSGGGTYVTLAAGGGETCAIDTGGTLSCWGANRNGELGIGMDGSVLVPALIP